MNHTILETQTLTKTFRSQEAVKNISLCVPENCVYGLLGPNGAGKSTLLKMITGILRPTSGQIRFHGPERIWQTSGRSLRRRPYTRT